jgi:hypothetical protein
LRFSMNAARISESGLRGGFGGGGGFTILGADLGKAGEMLAFGTARSIGGSNTGLSYENPRGIGANRGISFGASGGTDAVCAGAEAVMDTGGAGGGIGTEEESDGAGAKSSGCFGASKDEESGMTGGSSQTALAGLGSIAVFGKEGILTPSIVLRSFIVDCNRWIRAFSRRLFFKKR